MTTTAIPTSVDIQGLTQLKQSAAREDPGALAEAAVQFEALFIGLMLKSARDASLGEGIFDGSQTQQYLELMDQQVALDLARNGGFGFGKLLIDQLSPAADAATTGLAPLPSRPPAAGHFPSGLPATMLPPGAQRSDASDDAASRLEGQTHDTNPQDFVARLLPDATAAARKLGVEPRLLLAQAALETGWGEAAPRHPDGRPTNNLFGIKASGSWQGPSATAWTMENVDGVAERKRESFRAYSSSTDSFTDYADLIATTPRYSAALEQAHDPAAYVREVTDAGYATDPAYAQKWLAIYHGDRLTGALQGLKHGVAEPTK